MSWFTLIARLTFVSSRWETRATLMANSETWCPLMNRAHSSFQCSTKSIPSSRVVWTASCHEIEKLLPLIRDQVCRVHLSPETGLNRTGHRWQPSDGRKLCTWIDAKSRSDETSSTITAVCFGTQSESISFKPERCCFECTHRNNGSSTQRSNAEINWTNAMH